MLIYCRRKSIDARLIILDTNRSITKCDSLYTVKYIHKKEFEIKFIAVNVIKFYVIVRKASYQSPKYTQLTRSVQRNYWMFCVGLKWIQRMGKTDLFPRKS